jgi:HEAT repeat protein
VVDVLKKRFLILEAGAENKLFINDFFAFDLFNSLIKLGQTGFDLVFDIFKKYDRLNLGTLEDICELMGKSGRPEALDILLEIHFNEPEAGDAALSGLIIEENTVLPRIIPFLSSGQVHLRQRAMWFIANTFNMNLRNYLLKGLEDTNSGVREAAVYGLGRFCHATRKEILLQAVYDRAVNVRIRAIEALGSLFDSTLLPAFYSLCTDKSPKVRFEAMRAIASLESKQGVKFLNNLYETSTNADRLRIIKSLYAYTGNISQLKPLISKALSGNDKRIIQETNDLIEILQ